MATTYNLADTINIPELDIGGSTSGALTFTAPAVAGTQIYTLPTALPGTSGYLLSSTTAGVMSWIAPSGGAGGVSTLSIVSANGFAGTVATPTATPAITLSTTVGLAGDAVLLQGNGTSIQALADTTNLVGGAIGTSVFEIRDSTATNSTTFEPAALSLTTTNLNVTLTLPGTYPSANGQVMQSNSSGVMSWVTPTAAPSNYPTYSYSSASNIAVNDIFVGMAASVASFGQSYVADDSEVTFNNIEFHQKMWPSNTTIYPWITTVAYDEQSVNGVVTPTYVAMGGTTSASTPASRTIILTSTDGVNWTEQSNTNATVTLRYTNIVKGVLGTAPSQTSIWVAFSNTTTSPYLTSTDNGVTWTSVANPFGSVLVNHCIFDPVAQKFWVVTSGTTATTNLWSSTNGTTWTSVNSGVASALRRIIIGSNPTSTTGTFIAIGGNTTNAFSRTTNSGGTWAVVASCPTTTTVWANGVWDSVNSRFVISSTNFQISTSPSGLTATWTTATTAPTLLGTVSPSAPTSIGYSTTTGVTLSTLVPDASTVNTFGAANFFLFTTDAGTTIKSRNYTPNLYSDITVANGNQTEGVSDTKNIIFVSNKIGNFIGFKKKAIWVDDGTGISKAPLGTYKCLGRVGSLTTSYLWQRTA